MADGLQYFMQIQFKNGKGLRKTIPKARNVIINSGGKSSDGSNSMVFKVGEFFVYKLLLTIELEDRDATLLGVILTYFYI